jgi:uncharacterized iron-regulated membrane protein
VLSLNLGSAPARRQLWLSIHRWLGLFLLLLSIPIGLTGSVNVYHREIDRWLAPGFFQPRAQGEALPLRRILQIVRQHDPAPVVSMILPDAYWPVVLVHQRHGPVVWRTSIDPVSGEILGRRDQTHALLPTIYRLHQELLLKPYWGEELVGVSGLALALSCLSGLWLWWPKPQRFWKSVSLRRGQSFYRTNWDVHSAVGFWTSLVMLVVALSGVALSFPKGCARILGVVAPSRDYPPPSLPREGQPPLDNPDEILQAALRHRPDNVALVLGLPTARSNTWRVAMRRSDYHGVVGGLTQLWIDPWTYQVVQEKSAARWTTGDQIMAHQFPLHNGSLLGEPGRILVCLSGLAWALLGGTGLVLWWHKRRLAQRAAQARQKKRATTSEG